MFKGASKSCQRFYKCHPLDQFPMKESNRKVKNLPQSQLQNKFEDLYKQNEQWRKKKERERRNHEEKVLKSEVSECSFAPIIHKSELLSSTKQPFLQRQAYWKSSKQKKLQTERKKKDKMAVEQCSFKPKISQLPKTTKLIHSSSYADQKKNPKGSYKQSYMKRKEKLKSKAGEQKPVFNKLAYGYKRSIPQLYDQTVAKSPRNQQIKIAEQLEDQMEQKKEIKYLSKFNPEDIEGTMNQSVETLQPRQKIVHFDSAGLEDGSSPASSGTSSSDEAI